MKKIKRTLNKLHDAALMGITVFCVAGFFILPLSFETHDLMNVFFWWCLCAAWLSIFYIANK